MMDYDAYLISDSGGKDFIMRQLFAQVKWQQETIERLAREMDELKRKPPPFKPMEILIKEGGKVERFYRSV